MAQPESTVKRGFTASEAIQYLGIKRAQFEHVWRPHLVAMRQGSCVIFDRQDLDALFDRFKEEALQSQASQLAPPEDRSPSALRTRPFKGVPNKPDTSRLDFDEVVARITEAHKVARRQAKGSSLPPSTK